MKHKSCTDYWLNADTMSLRGEFEEMYRDIDDPWGCQKGYDSLNNRIFGEILFDGRKFERILDIGCGLGGFANYLSMKNEGGVVGCDISSTAIKKASDSYRQVRFVIKNILKDEIDDLGMFDLIVFSEVIWYILDSIERVFKKVSNALSEKGMIGIHQYFPFNQRFGKAIIDGISGFEDFVIKQTNFQMSKKVVSYVSDGGVLLAILERRV